MITWILGGIALPIVALIVHDLVRRPTIRRLALRNVARRKGEAALVIAGSLLGTAIITASFIVGDTLRSSIRDAARTALGPVDEVVRVTGLSPLPSAEAAVRREPPIPGVDGVLTAISAQAALQRSGDDPRAEPHATLLEIDFDKARAFGSDPSITGLAGAGATPKGDELVIPEDLARTLGVAKGAKVELFAYGARRTFTVRQVVPKVGLAGFGQPSAFVAPGTIAGLADPVVQRGRAETRRKAGSRPESLVTSDVGTILDPPVRARARKRPAMKTLPDSPSLEHLRQQAKDVLPHLRTVRAGSTLSDAQSHIARQYGFRTWPELKAEVDRRSASAVAPALADDTAVELAAAFGLGEAARPLVPLIRQWSGHAWTLTTDRGTWTARRLFGPFYEANLETDARLAERADADGIVTPVPVRSASGNLAETVGDARWRVFTAPLVGPDPSMPADPRYAAAAGRILGRVHAWRLPPEGPVTTWVSEVRPEAAWRRLQEKAEEAGKPWAGPLAEAIPTIVDAYDLVESLAAAGETVLSGAHFAFCTVGADDLAVMGWDHASAIPTRWEFGANLAGWSEGVLGRVNGKAARAFLAGYAETNGVPDRLDLSIFSSAVCTAGSWLMSRIRIALFEHDAEARELADRAVPWLLGEPPSSAHYAAVLAAVRG